MASPHQKRSRLASPSLAAGSDAPASAVLAPAAQRALAIPEIVEAVLAQITSWRELQRCRGVSRLWQDTALPALVSDVRNEGGAWSASWLGPKRNPVDLDISPQWARYIRSVSLFNTEMLPIEALNRDIAWTTRCTDLASLTVDAVAFELLFSQPSRHAVSPSSNVPFVFPELQNLTFTGVHGGTPYTELANAKKLSSIRAILGVWQDWEEYCQGLSSVLQHTSGCLTSVVVEFGESFWLSLAELDVAPLSPLLGDLLKLRNLSLRSGAELTPLFALGLPPSLESLTVKSSDTSLGSLFRHIAEHPTLDHLVPSLTLHLDRSADVSSDEAALDEACIQGAIAAYERRTRLCLPKERQRTWRRLLYHLKRPGYGSDGERQTGGGAVVSAHALGSTDGQDG